MVCLVSVDEVPPLPEALHRIAAELGTIGFPVTRGSLGQECAADGPYIGIHRHATRIEIEANAGGQATSIIQQVDPGSPRTNAELVAIRAVEGLRAAMVQVLREHPAQRQRASATVLSFTHTDVEPSSPGPTAGLEPETPQTTEPAQTAASPTKRASPRVLLLLGAGPSFDGGAPAFGLELGVDLLLPGLVLGASFDAGLLPGTWNAELGSVAARDFTVAASVGARLPCPSSFECQVNGVVGIRQSSIEPVPDSESPSPTLSQANHFSTLVGGEGLLAYFFVPNWGVVLHGRAGTLLDAPRLEAGDESILWGRPTISVRAGMAGRF